MEPKFVEFSVVILANDHNPTVLNPDFLQRNLIVKDEWGWTVVGQPLTTPAISNVTYGSGAVVTLEPMKLQVTDTSGLGIEKNHVCDIVSNYVSILPHVEYSALGVNFTFVTEVEDPVGYLLERFLKDGPWNQKANKMQSVGYKFAYELDNGIVTFTIDKGVNKNTDKPFFISRANFHRSLDVSSMPTSNQIQTYLGNIMVDWDKIKEIHSTIFKE